MLVVSALIEIGDPAAGDAARGVLARMRVCVAEGSVVDAYECCTRLYALARRRCLALVASEAAVVAALAYHASGDTVAAAAWARQALAVVPHPDMLTWAPLALVLAARGHLDAGEHAAAFASVSEALRLLAVNGPHPDRDVVRELAGRICQGL